MMAIRRYMALMACAVALFTGCVTEEDEPVWSLGEGDRLPFFAVETVSGRVLSTESLEGSVAVLVFFNTSCQDCRAELPRIQTAYDHMSVTCGSSAEWVCVSRQEGRESVMAYWAKQGLTLPVAPQDDRGIYDKFASSGIPRVYVADKAGVITAVFSDSHLPSAAEIEDAVAAAVSKETDNRREW